MGHRDLCVCVVCVCVWFVYVLQAFEALRWDTEICVCVWFVCVCGLCMFCKPLRP